MIEFYLIGEIEVIKMKYTSLILLFVTLVMPFGCSSILAQDAICIDNAQNNNEVDECGNKIVFRKEAEVEKEFNRLFEKYKSNDEMKELILLTKQGWNNYRNLLCNFAGAAAAGGQTKGRLPVEANKEYLRCVIRTLDEMEFILKNIPGD